MIYSSVQKENQEIYFFIKFLFITFHLIQLYTQITISTQSNRKRFTVYKIQYDLEKKGEEATKEKNHMLQLVK